MGYGEILCVEVIHPLEKTGGCYKGKNKRATVIIQIFVRSEVKAECLWCYIMIGHRVLISCTIDNSWDCILNYHPSICLALHLENDFSVHPSSLHPSFRPFLNILIKKKRNATKHLCWTSFYSSITSSIPPLNSYCLFTFLLHPFIFCGWGDVHYLLVIHSFIILPSMKHTTQLYCCAQSLFICHIIHISSCFPAGTYLSTIQNSFLSF